MHRFAINRFEFSIIIPGILITILSLATFYLIDFTIFRQQLTFLIMGIILYLLFLNIDYRIFGFYSKYSYALMVGALVLLFLIGVEARGAVRWIDVFGVRIQFSEIIKPFFIIFMASYLTSNDSRSIGKFLKAILFILPIFILIAKQPDLGNALIYLFVSCFMILIYGFPMKYFVGLSTLILALMPFIFNLLADYQKQRVLTFVNPALDPLSSSYNIVQSLISIGSGGLTGKGFGQATQSILKFLPERHTDFIFATISESLGFLGAMALLILYFYLLLKIYKVTIDVDNEFTKLVVIGFYFLFLFHVLLNVGMNIGIVPIVGITLPFASYGGSSLLTFFIILGIISSIKFDFKKRRMLEIE